MSQPTFWFGQVDPDNVESAFEWHQKETKSQPYVFSLYKQKFERLAADWQIFICRNATGNFAGLVYYSFENNYWIVGGTTVSSHYRNKGVAKTLTCIVLIHILVQHDALAEHQPIMAFIHRRNQKSRALVQQIGVSSIYRSSDSNSNYDAFSLEYPQALHTLILWVDNWKGKLADGTPAEIQSRTGLTLQELRQALIDMVT